MEDTTLVTLISSLKGAIEKFKKAGLGVKSLKDLLTAIVKAVEIFSSDTFQGVDKKKATLETLDEIYVLSGIDIPFIPDSWERRILRFIAGWLIDSIVADLNKHGWE